MTNIEWTHGPGYKGETWNWLRGCNRVSPGCDRCYAIRDAHRYQNSWGRGLTVIRNGHPDWSGEIAFVRHKLQQPMRWRKPRMAFVNSGSDTFHHLIPFERIAAAYGVMAATSGRHIFQVLTKRTARRLAFHQWLRDQDWAKEQAEQYREQNDGRVDPSPETIVCVRAADREGLIDPDLAFATEVHDEWPLRNVWEGTSVEGRDYIWRARELRKTPAALRFLSIEPLLEDLGSIRDVLPGIHWVIVGGESGGGARTFEVQWARSLIGQCRDVGVAVFVKQVGAVAVDSSVNDLDGTPSLLAGLRNSKGGDPDEWPEDIRVREFPEVI